MSEVEVVAEILTEVTLDDPAASDAASSAISLVTVGATVPTGFEFTAAAEVEEKLGRPCRISKDRGKIYFDIGLDALAQVHRLRSVDNLFVVVQEFTDFPFKDAKEAALQDFQELAAKLSWEKALKTWELNNNLKKKKKRKKTGGCSKERKTTAASGAEESEGGGAAEEQPTAASGAEKSTGGGAEQEQPAVASGAEGSAGGATAEEQPAKALDAEGSAGGGTAEEQSAMAVGSVAGGTEEEQPAMASGAEGSAGGGTAEEQLAMAEGSAGGGTAEEQSAMAVGSVAGCTEEEQPAMASGAEGSAGGGTAEEQLAMAVGSVAGGTEEEQSAMASGAEGSAGGGTAEEQSAMAEGSAGGGAEEEQPAVALGAEGSAVGGAAEEQSAPPAGQEKCKTPQSQAEDSAEFSTPCFNVLHENDTSDDAESNDSSPDVSNILKFRVTCNRAGDKHSFTSNEAARDFGGAVQEHFLWKADMTNFDVEVLLNISYNEMLVGIALTEESLHRRNITHFGPTTLRSTLAYGMLRLCDLEPSDVVIDPMCGTGAIPIEGVSEWPGCFFIAGDNNTNAVNRTSSNIGSLLRRQQSADSAPQGLQIDLIHWDISRLPLRSGSVDVIITDMPFGKRIGSKKRNWDLYPACLREMSRVCRAGTGRAVLLTHDRKCFIKALAKAGHLWRKMHTVWVNIGGLHAGVYLLKRTVLDFFDSSSQRLEENKPLSPSSPAKEE